MFAPEPEQVEQYKPPKHLAGQAVVANYIDDNYTLTQNATVGRKVLTVLKATTTMVGGKRSASKELNNKKEGKVLGAIVVAGRLRGKKPAGMRLPADKAIPMLASMRELLQSHCNTPIQFTKLETLLGRCCWVSYLGQGALLRTLPLVALKWMPKGMRFDVFRMDHPLRWEIMESINWWLKLLDVRGNSPYIWKASNPPTSWIDMASDASESSWAVHDYHSTYLFGMFHESERDDIIAAKELRAVNNYIEYAKPSHGSGIRLLCDNMQVMWASRKKAVSPHTDSKFKKEYWHFARLVEQRSLRVLVDWISTHNNLCADWGTRSRPLLGAVSASALVGRRLNIVREGHQLTDIERAWRSRCATV